MLQNSQKAPCSRVFRQSVSWSCPYLPGRRERQIFTLLEDAENSGNSGSLTNSPIQEDFDLLSKAGFRRSGNIMYRPVCKNCNSCVSVRVRIPDFKLSGSFRRLLRSNKDLSCQRESLSRAGDYYSLFCHYIKERHGDGPMAKMSYADYSRIFARTGLDSFLWVIRDEAGHVLGVCLVDGLSDGFSAVYSFFTPNSPARGLGNYVILSLIEEAKKAGKNYLYLGYWVKGSDKMAYKARFGPLEGYVAGRWSLLSSLKRGAKR